MHTAYPFQSGEERRSFSFGWRALIEQQRTCLNMNKIPKTKKRTEVKILSLVLLIQLTGWFRDGSCNTDKTDVGMPCCMRKSKRMIF
jgi:hypothetical protein